MSSTGSISSLLTGLLVPLCTYIILAVSLNLVVGILGELSLGRIVGIARDRHCGQDSYDGHNDHQFNEGKTFLDFRNHFVSLVVFVFCRFDEHPVVDEKQKYRKERRKQPKPEFSRGVSDERRERRAEGLAPETSVGY